jgi:hypothetical protein
MFDELVQKILEGFNVLPRARAAMKSGPNVVGPGPVPAGFLGGGLPQINPSASPVILVAQKPKKKKKITKKRSRF